MKSHWKPFVFVLEWQKGHGMEPRNPGCFVTELKGDHLPALVKPNETQIGVYSKESKSLFKEIEASLGMQVS